jgi:hypothetical protein
VNLSESALAISSRSSAHIHTRNPLFKGQNQTPPNPKRDQQTRADKTRQERAREPRGRPPTADEALHGVVPRPQHPPLHRPLPLAAALPPLPRHPVLRNFQPDPPNPRPPVPAPTLAGGVAALRLR